MPSIGSEYTIINYVNNISELKLNYSRIIEKREKSLDAKHPHAGFPFLAEKSNVPTLFFPNTHLGVVNMRIISEFNEHLLLKSQKKDIAAFRKRMWKRVWDYCGGGDYPLITREAAKKAIRFTSTLGGREHNDDYMQQDYMYLNDPDRKIYVNSTDDIDFDNHAQEMVYMFIEKKIKERDEKAEGGSDKIDEIKYGKKIKQYIMPFIRRRRILKKLRNPKVKAKLLNREDREKLWAEIAEKKYRAKRKRLDEDRDPTDPDDLYVYNVGLKALEDMKKFDMNKEGPPVERKIKKVKLHVKSKNPLINDEIAARIAATAAATAARNKEETDRLFNQILAVQEAKESSGLDMKHKPPVVIIQPPPPPKPAFSDSDVVIIEQPKIDPLVGDIEHYANIKFKEKDLDKRFSELDTYTQNMIAFERAREMHKMKVQALADAKNKIISLKRAGFVNPPTSALAMAQRTYAEYESKLVPLPPSIMLAAQKRVDPLLSLAVLPPEKKKAKPKKKEAKKESKKEAKKPKGRPKKVASKKPATKKKGPKIGAPSEFKPELKSKGRPLEESLAKLNKILAPNPEVESELAKAKRRKKMSEQKKQKKEAEAKAEKEYQDKEETKSIVTKLKKAQAKRKKQKALFQKSKKVTEGDEKKDAMRDLFVKGRKKRRKMTDILAEREKESKEKKKAAKKKKKINLSQLEEMKEGGEKIKWDEDDELQLAADLMNIREEELTATEPDEMDIEEDIEYGEDIANMSMPESITYPQGFGKPHTIIVPEPSTQPVIVPVPTAIANPPVNFFKPPPVIVENKYPPPPPPIPIPPVIQPLQDAATLINSLKDIICNEDPRIMAARVALGCPPPTT